jgi:hypothetical protein
LISAAERDLVLPVANFITNETTDPWEKLGGNWEHGNLREGVGAAWDGRVRIREGAFSEIY